MGMVSVVAAGGVLTGELSFLTGLLGCVLGVVLPPLLGLAVTGGGVARTAKGCSLG